MQKPAPRKWVFIAGCYNSGTTLLHDLLALHPLVGAMPNEGQFFTDQLMTGAKAGVRRLWASKPGLFRMNEGDHSVNVHRLKKQWAYFYNHPKRPLLIEKTIANAARTRWLQENFKPASFICLFRNGYAVAEGIHRKESHPVEIGIQQWVTANEILMEDMTYLQRKIQVTYEELTEKPEETVRRITDFLEIEPLPSSVFESNFQIHKVKSHIRNMNEDAIGNLKPEQLEIINDFAAPTLEKLGYSKINP